MPQPVQGDFSHHGNRGSVQELAHIGPGEGGSEEHSAVLVHYQLRPAFVVFRVQGRSRHLDGQVHG